MRTASDCIHIMIELDYKYIPDAKSREVINVLKSTHNIHVE